MPRTTIFGWYDDNIFGAVERVNDHVAVPPVHEPRQRYWRFIAKRAILATGAEERPITFGGNDVPGVMTASAMRAFANHYGVAAGRSIAVGCHTRSSATIAPVASSAATMSVSSTETKFEHRNCAKAKTKPPTSAAGQA